MTPALRGVEPAAARAGRAATRTADASSHEPTPSPTPPTPTARRTVTSEADSIRLCNSTVFPIPASPRSTRAWLSPRRTSASNPSSRPHSFARPRRGARRPGAAKRVSISPHRSYRTRTPQPAAWSNWAEPGLRSPPADRDDVIDCRLGPPASLAGELGSVPGSSRAQGQPHMVQDPVRAIDGRRGTHVRHDKPPDRGRDQQGTSVMTWPRLLICWLPEGWDGPFGPACCRGVEVVYVDRAEGTPCS